MPKFTDIKPGDALPERRYVPTNVSLFLYNAAIWNAHRIHYDRPYAAARGYPGLSGGKVESVDPEKKQAEFSLYVKVEGGDITAPGRAVVRFYA